MLSEFAEKKETFLTMNNRIFQSKKKSHFFSKRLNAFGEKCQILLFLHLVKIRLEMMLSNFVEKEESLKNRLFQRG